jgi:hypothetical protein
MRTAIAVALLLAATGLQAKSQAELCAPNDAEGDMRCVDRNGHCMGLVVDGQSTVALPDGAAAARVAAIKHGEDVCWQLTQPVSTRLRAQVKPGGIVPGYVGKIEKLAVNVYPLADYDPEFDSRLDSLNGVDLVVDGDPNGSWRLEAEKPLPAGEYVIVFRAFGVDNWDKQAVLLTLDPKLAPTPPAQ